MTIYRPEILLYGPGRLPRTGRPLAIAPAQQKISADISRLLNERFGKTLSINSGPRQKGKTSLLIGRGPSWRHHLKLTIEDRRQGRHLTIRPENHEDYSLLCLAGKINQSLERYLSVWGVNQTKQTVAANTVIAKFERGQPITLDRVNDQSTAADQFAAIISHGYSRELISRAEYLSLVEGSRWSKNDHSLMRYLINSPLGRRALQDQFIAVCYRP